MSYAQADLVKELLAVEEQLTQGHAWAAVELAPDDWSRLVRLARGEVLPARRPYPLAVLACSATKADVESCPARDLYTGDLFKAGRQRRGGLDAQGVDERDGRRQRLERVRVGRGDGVALVFELEAHRQA